MRQAVGEKKLRKYRLETGLPICRVLVRGGTDHRVDLLIPDGIIIHWWCKTKKMELLQGISWDYKGWLLKNDTISAHQIK